MPNITAVVRYADLKVTVYNGEGDVEGGTFARLTLRHDLVVMLLHDPLGDGETQPCAGPLAGKEGLEDEGGGLFRLCRCRVGYGDGCGAIGRRGPHLDPSSRWHRLQGVLDQGQERLFYLNLKVMSSPGMKENSTP